MCSFCSVVFFVKDTPTPEIYTYGHTLSLHDALPISSRSRERALRRAAGAHARRDARPRARSRAPRGRRGSTLQPARVASPLDSRGRHGSPRLLPARSEEHTSELQSLMRISYAVFCLKKKNKKVIRLKQTQTIY